MRYVYSVRNVPLSSPPTPLDASDIDALDATLATSATCLRPGCSGIRTFRRTRQGRQQRFCSDACRAAYSRERADLIATWVRLRWTQGFSTLPVPSPAIDRLLSRVRWLLDGYDAPQLGDGLLPRPTGGIRDILDVWMEEGELPEGHALLAEANAATEAFYQGRKNQPSPIRSLPKLVSTEEYAATRTQRSPAALSVDEVPVDTQPRFAIGIRGSEATPELPLPEDLIDDGHDADVRSLVARYFAYGTLRVSRPGEVPCRLCSETFPDVEVTDGEYVWPITLAHYVEQHSVRLPDHVERYVLLTFRDVLAAEPDTSWWTTASEARIRQTRQ